MRIVSAAELRDALTHELAREAVAHALAAHLAGRTSTSQPPLLRLDAGGGAVFQAKGASIDDVAGLRLAGGRDGRHLDEGRRILLYDTTTLTPRALVEEADLYRHRVGAQVALAVERLAPPSSRTLVVVGAGRLARAVVSAIQAYTPMERVGIHARTIGSSARAADELSASEHGSVWAVTDLPKAVQSADVVVTISTAARPVVSGRDLSGGTLVVSAGGGWECDEDVYRRAHRLYVDDWEHCVQVGDLAQLASRGVVGVEDVTGTLPEVIGSGTVAPCSPGEVVVAVPQGMTVSDVALAVHVLDVLEQR